jgi:hypothetical protein
VLRTAILVLCPLALMAGCGNSRTPLPSVSQPLKPNGFHAIGNAQAGIAISVPNNWLVQSQAAPLLTVSSGTAVVALWRFRRHLAPPVGAAALDAAERQLIGAARARDPSLQLIRSRTETIDAAPAIELDAFERIGGQARRVRSTHVFTAGTELVLDEYAPPSIFHAVDHVVFSPLKRSLRLSAA